MFLDWKDAKDGKEDKKRVKVAVSSPEDEESDSDSDEVTSPSSPSRLGREDPVIGGWGSLDDDDV